MFTVALRIAYNGTTDDGERMIAPLRAVASTTLDTVADMPYTAVASIHDEPTEPLPYYERSIMLREFPVEAQNKLVELVGPDSDTTMWIAELRALGGAWDREPAVPNAVATRGLPYVLLGVDVGPLSEEQRLKESIAALLDGMAPWRGDRLLVNNLAPEEATDALAIYGPECYERLARVKRRTTRPTCSALTTTCCPPAEHRRSSGCDARRARYGRLCPVVAAICSWAGPVTIAGAD